MRTFGLHILVILLFFSCTEKPTDKFTVDERALMQKYPPIFRKFKDTTLVLNSFRYIKIDTTTYSHLRILPKAIWETDYRLSDYDSILRRDYKIRTVYIRDYYLYIKLFSIKFSHDKKNDPHGIGFDHYIFQDIPQCVGYIYDTLRLKPKIPYEVLRKSMQLVLERATNLGIIDPSKITNINLFLFRPSSIEDRFFYITRNDSVIYRDNAFWYLSRYRDIIVNNVADTAGIFPVRINFDTSGKFLSINLHKKLTTEQMSLLNKKIGERNNVFKIRLINNKPVTFSFNLLTSTLNSKDEKM